jgi:DNA modification methylase
MNEIITGDCLEVMKGFADEESVSQLIWLLPPYGISFMGKDWGLGGFVLRGNSEGWEDEEDENE